MERGKDVEKTLFDAGNIRTAPVTRLIGPDNEVYDLRAARSASLSVGRSQQRDIKLPERYNAVSQHQCNLKLKGNRWLVTHHLQATNPTLINGVEIVAAWLKLGQELQLGNKDFLAYAGDDHLRGARAAQAFSDKGSYAAAARALDNADVKTVARLVKKHQDLWSGVVSGEIHDGDSMHLVPHRGDDS